MSENYRSFTGTLRLLERSGPYMFPVEVRLLNDRINRKGWRFTNMEGNAPQFAGKPMLVAYIRGGKGIGDGHNFREVTDPVTGEERASFTDAEAERIVGAFSEQPGEIRTEVRDGTTWIVGRGYLWQWYAQELVAKIEQDARQGREMSVSIEALATDSHMEDDVEVIDRYIILGATILGDHVQPAVDGARIAALSEGEEFRTLKLRAASYCEMDKTDSTRRKVVEAESKEGVRTTVYLSKQQLKELQKKFGDTFVVLSAKQTGDNKIHVLLRRVEDRAYCAYTMGAEDAVVHPEEVRVQAAQIVVQLSEDETLVTDASEEVECLVSALEAETAKLNSALSAAERERDEAKNALTDLRDRESKRRVSAAKERAASTLREFNANREAKVAESVLETVNSEIESGLYTNSVDADGNWTGENAVKQKVLAACAEAVMQQDKTAAGKARRTLTWDLDARGGQTAGTIGELFSGGE